MASSTQKTLTDAITEIMKIPEPKNILDIGMGFGKWGFLCREYLEGWRSRVEPHTWKIIIDSIEIWEPFTKLPWNKIMYNNIYLGDAHGVIDKLEDYDLIIASDVIEHLEKEKATKLLESCIKKAKTMFMLNIPLGKGWLNNVIVDGNIYNKHLSSWELEEIEAFAKKYNRTLKTYIWQGVRGAGVLAIFKK